METVFSKLTSAELKHQDANQLTRYEYSKLLTDIAENLLKIAPSRIQDEDIWKLEKVLNNLYATAHFGSWPSDLQEATLEALSRASELCDVLKRTKSAVPRSRVFFKTIKEFIPLFQVMAVYLEE